jgi:hypothetical protein
MIKRDRANLQNPDKPPSTKLGGLFCPTEYNAIAHSVYRETEKISLITLDKMPEIPIDMLTVIIIGNQSTRIYENSMITPRGDLGFN